MNNLVIQLSQSKQTFIESRGFMLKELSKTKDEILAIEAGSVSECVPLYIKFLEYKGICMTEALYYFYITVPHITLWSLILATINGVFKKIEQNDLNFIPY